MVFCLELSIYVDLNEIVRIVFIDVVPSLRHLIEIHGLIHLLFVLVEEVVLKVAEWLLRYQVEMVSLGQHLNRVGVVFARVHLQRVVLVEVVRVEVWAHRHDLYVEFFLGLHIWTRHILRILIALCISASNDLSHEAPTLAIDDRIFARADRVLAKSAAEEVPWQRTFLLSFDLLAVQLATENARDGCLLPRLLVLL